MKISLFIYLLTSNLFASIADYRSESLKVDSKITEATTYSDRALITRKVPFNYKSNSWFKIGPLPKSVNKDSIRAQVKLPFLIERIVIEDTYEKVSIDKEIERNLEVLENLYSKKIELIQQRRLLQSTYEFSRGLYFNSPFLKSNQNYVSFQSPVLLLGNAFESIVDQNSKSYDNLLKMQNKIRVVNKEINFLKRWMQNKTNTSQQRWVTYLYLYINKEGSKAKKGSLDISYIIPNASWLPVYDLRAKFNKSRGIVNIDLITSGLVKQNTKEDWKGIEITLSSLDPYPLHLPHFSRWAFKESRIEDKSKEKSESNFGNRGSFLADSLSSVVKSSNAPKRMKHKKMRKRQVQQKVASESVSFDMEESKVSAPSVSMVKLDRADESGGGVTNMAQVARRSNKGKVDSSQSFPLVKPENYFNELRVIKNNIVAISHGSGEYRSYKFPTHKNKYKKNNYSNHLLPAVSSRGRKIEIKSPFKFDLKSDNEQVKIPLKSQKFQGKLSYLIIPKKDKRAFIKAKVVNRSKAMILAGKAQVFMDGDLVSKTQISTVNENSYFEVNLGVDQNVESKRIVKKKSMVSGFSIIKKHLTEVNVEIQIVNHNNFPINIDLRDHFPLSPGEDIEIEFIKTSHKTYHENTNGLLYWRKTIKPKTTDKTMFSYKVTHPFNYIMSEFD
jgi:hypothetical protein